MAGAGAAFRALEINRFLIVNGFGGGTLRTANRPINRAGGTEPSAAGPTTVQAPAAARFVAVITWLRHSLQAAHAQPHDERASADTSSHNPSSVVRASRRRQVRTPRVIGRKGALRNLEVIAEPARGQMPVARPGPPFLRKMTPSITCGCGISSRSSGKQGSSARAYRKISSTINPNGRSARRDRVPAIPAPQSARSAPVSIVLAARSSVALGTRVRGPRVGHQEGDGRRGWPVPMKARCHRGPSAGVGREPAEPGVELFAHRGRCPRPGACDRVLIVRQPPTDIQPGGVGERERHRRTEHSPGRRRSATQARQRSVH